MNERLNNFLATKGGLIKIIRPEFFDIFGIGTFAFLTFVALWGLLRGEALPDLVLYLILFIGVAGLIIDGSIVYKTYIRRRK